MVSGRSFGAMAWLLTLLSWEALLNNNSYFKLAGLYIFKALHTLETKLHMYKEVSISLLKGKSGAVWSSSVNVTTAEAASSLGTRCC